VRYYFSKADSLPFRIEYRWDPNAHLDRDQRSDSALWTIEPIGRLAEYKAQYESLRSVLVNRYGKPSLFMTLEPAGPDGFERVGNGKGGYFWSRWERWEHNEIMADMQMIFSESTAPGGSYMITLDQKWP
jgi:hypothetical protein